MLFSLVRLAVAWAVGRVAVFEQRCDCGCSVVEMVVVVRRGTVEGVCGVLSCEAAGRGVCCRERQWLLLCVVFVVVLWIWRD